MAIQLTKGQKISLKKENGDADVKTIMLGLGWDVGDEEQIDLDASCVSLNARKEVLDYIYFGSKTNRTNSILHSGDNLTGAGEGDDEVIIVHLDKIPQDVQHIVFTVNSYRGQKFTAVQNAYVRIVNQATKVELCRYDLSEQFPTTGVVMARLYRHNGEWKFGAIGEGANGQTIKDMVKPIQAILG